MCNKSQNPFYLARQKAGLSLNDFATLLGIGSTTAMLLEKGAISHPKIPIQKLAALGYDPENISSQYQSWRQDFRTEAQERLKVACEGRES